MLNFCYLHNVYILTLSMLDKISAKIILKYFLIFPRKQDLTVSVNFMRCQSLFSCQKTMSSTEFAQRVVEVKIGSADT